MKKMVLISGANGGLGRAVTKHFIDNGFHVAALYSSEASGKALKAIFADSSISYFQADLNDESAVTNLYQQLSPEADRLEAVIHLAGGFWMGEEIANTSMANWRKMMTMNLDSAFLFLRGGFSLLKKSGGKIFTISAKPALELPALMGAYAVSKAGLSALTEILNKEGKTYNIAANTIYPGIIDTPANRAAMPGADVSKWVTTEAIARVLLACTEMPDNSLSGAVFKMYDRP
jgi:NAD(P)-dependent dehydrogenase (short-subunit alcohol dehydrogenase family)